MIKKPLNFAGKILFILIINFIFGIIFISLKSLPALAGPTISPINIERTSGQNITPITFTITSSYSMTEPFIFIYDNGNDCSGNTLITEPIVTDTTQQNGTYNWTHFSVNREYSVKILDAVAGRESECIHGTTPDANPIPVPHPPAPQENCPIFLFKSPNSPAEGDNIRFTFEPPISGHINDYSLVIQTRSIEVDFQEQSGHWNAIVNDLPEGGPYHVTVRLENGTECPVQDIAVGPRPAQPPSLGLGSGRNPCDIPNPENPNQPKCRTALGDISTNITYFAGDFLSIALGLAGGIALILLVFGSIRVLTSSGNQQSLAAGRDTIIAAVAGLLFLIFSVLILRALGLVIGIPFS